MHPGDCLKQGDQVHPEGGSAKGPCGGSDHCNAHLNRCQESFRVVAKGLGRVRPADLSLDQFLDPGPSDRNDGNLGSREDAVQQDEDGNDRCFKKNGTSMRLMQNRLP